jgi:hypothetical protein
MSHELAIQKMPLSLLLESRPHFEVMCRGLLTARSFKHSYTNSEKDQSFLTDICVKLCTPLLNLYPLNLYKVICTTQFSTERSFPTSVLSVNVLSPFEQLPEARIDFHPPLTQNVLSSLWANLKCLEALS